MKNYNYRDLFSTEKTFLICQTGTQSVTILFNKLATRQPAKSDQTPSSPESLDLMR